MALFHSQIRRHNSLAQISRKCHLLFIFKITTTIGILKFMTHYMFTLVKLEQRFKSSVQIDKISTVSLYLSKLVTILLKRQFFLMTRVIYMNNLIE